MTPFEPHIFTFREPIQLECGVQLRNWQVAFHTFGRLNDAKDNVIWVCHALTANSDVFDWWPGMVGPGKLMDTDKYFIICANILGSCYGTTGPLSTDPATGLPWYRSFPLITVRDLVKAHQALRNFLGITSIKLGLGGSLGGQQILEWAIAEPELFEFIAPIATNARASAWGIGFGESQRMAILADESFYHDTPDGGSKGMMAARSIALLSYRNQQAYNLTQTDPDESKMHDFKVCSYQQYQGEKLRKRFNAYSYLTLTKTLDSNHVGRGRGGIGPALQQIKAKSIVIGITSDLLFPLEEQKTLAELIPDAKLHQVESFYGHDGFLIEVESITKIIRPYLESSHHENNI